MIYLAVRFRKLFALVLSVLTITTSAVAFDASGSEAQTQDFYSLLRSRTSETYTLAIVEQRYRSTTIKQVKQLDFSQVSGRHYPDLRAAGYNVRTGTFWAFDFVYQELFSISPETGLVSFHGRFTPRAPGGITAMAVDSNGYGYALDANNLLYQVNFNNAQLYSPQAIKNLSSTTKDIESMTFSGTTLYAYAERSASSSSDSPVLGYALQIEYSNLAWRLTNSYYDTGPPLDAYGLVIQGNKWLLNTLYGSYAYLTEVTPTPGNSRITFTDIWEFPWSSQLTRGFYAVSPETITFDSNGGTAVSSVSGPSRSSFSEPVQPTRAGASFEGWFTARTGGTKITWPYTVNGSTTLYAQWNATPATISFDSHGGSATASISAFVGDEITAPADPVLSGYGFDGWYTSANGGTQVAWPYSLTGDTTLHAVWSQTPAALTLKSENGSSDVVSNSFVGVEIDEPQAPTKTGTTFKGWYTAQNGGTRVSWPYTLTANTTMWAQWEATLQFVSQGGTPVDSVVQDAGTAVTQPSNPINPYKNFSGWFTEESGGTAIQWPLTLNTDTVVYARWTDIPAVLTFNSQGGSAVNSIQTIRGELVSEPSEPTRSNAAFEGWFDQSTGGEKVTWAYLMTGDKTLFAQWNTVPVTLRFDSQGGSPVSKIETYAGEEINMPIAPTRPGYTFKGWYESLSSENSLIWPYEVTTDTVLYARWERNTSELAATGGSHWGTAGILGAVLLGSGVLALAIRRRYF